MAKIKINNDGPLLVEGDFELCDGSGASYGLGDKKIVALCRCGQSANKPFCDGAHSREGFRSEVQAQEL